MSVKDIAIQKSILDEILVPVDIIGKDDKDGAPGSQKSRRMD